MSVNFDGYYHWLGIPPEEQPPHHYRLLGLRLFENNPAVIENSADRQMAYLRSVQAGEQTEAAQRILNQIASARICLLNAGKKAEYDRALPAHIERPIAMQSPAAPEFTPPASHPTKQSVKSAATMAPLPMHGPATTPDVKPLLLIAGGAALVLVLLVCVAALGMASLYWRSSGDDVANAATTPSAQNGGDGKAGGDDLATAANSNTPPQPVPAPLAGSEGVLDAQFVKLESTGGGSVAHLSVDSFEGKLLVKAHLAASTAAEELDQMRPGDKVQAVIRFRSPAIPRVSLPANFLARGAPPGLRFLKTADALDPDPLQAWTDIEADCTSLRKAESPP